jgi:hypothetical protein
MENAKADPKSLPFLLPQSPELCNYLQKAMINLG